MSLRYYKRIDVGQVFIMNGKQASPVYVCPYGMLTDHGMYCPYREDYDEECARPSMNPYKVRQLCCPRNNAQNTYCFKIVYLNGTSYVEAPTTFKEESKMDVNKIKNARRFPDGVCITEDDIVIVSIDYSKDKLLCNMRKFKARVVHLDSTGVTLDLSDRYESKVAEVAYSSIISIAVIQEDKPCSLL